MNSRRSITLATLVTAAAISFVSMAQAQVQTLNIIENSSTSLTATLNGGAPLPVSLGGGEFWIISLPGVSVSGGASWQEPGETTINEITGVPGQGVVGVVSDEPGTRGAGLPDGTTDTTSFKINLSPLAVTFTDLGDTPSTVPDTATTFELLGLSLAALGIMAKVRPLIFRPFNG